MGQKFLISEQDRFHIKKLYGLITEAVEPYTQSQRVTFEAGYYGPSYAAPFLDPIIENIKNFSIENDVMMSNLQKKYNAYSSSEVLATQIESYSNIENKMVNYNWLIK